MKAFKVFFNDFAIQNDDRAAFYFIRPREHGNLENNLTKARFLYLSPINIFVKSFLWGIILCIIGRQASSEVCAH
jgi:hypothetical protein